MKNQKGFSAVEGLLILVIVGLLSFTGWYVYQNENKKDKSVSGSASLTCTPIVATSLEEQSLIDTYKKFAKAVADKDQGCVNGLTTSHFFNLAKQTFDAADGKWITAEPLGTRPISDDFSQLPDTLDRSLFKQKDYTRPTVVGAAPTESLSGKKLSYPVDLSKFTGDNSKWYASLSFVNEDGKILVDDVTIEPEAMVNQ